MKRYLAVLVSVAALIQAGVSSAGDDVLSSQLRSVAAANIAATSKDSESITDFMNTIHSGSPAYVQIKTQMEQLMPAFDMEASLVEFSFIGVDGGYAIARVKQKLKKVSGPLFQDNVSEQMFIFHQELGEWKIWQVAMLNVESL